MMDRKDKEFLKKLAATFLIEAREHIRALSSGLVELEKARGPARTAIIENIFREAHSLKGAARAVNMSEAESVCQSLESIFAALKRSEMQLSSEVFDGLHQSVDLLDSIVSRADADTATADHPTIDTQPQSLLSSGPVTETIRITTAKLDALFLQAEEMVYAKSAARHRAGELREVKSQFAVWEKEWKKLLPDIQRLRHSFGRTDVSSGALDKTSQLKNILEFVDWSNSFVKSCDRSLDRLMKSAENDQRLIAPMIDNLLESAKKALMLPFSPVLELLPRFVRDLARDQGKEVEMMMNGGEIEVDKRILEEIKDPLIHLIRNCVDHGIEKPDERKKKQKSPQGRITVSIGQKDGNRIEIAVSDDGNGIDLASVKSAVVKLGIVSSEGAEKLSNQAALLLIFESGVTTSRLITEISGRGLGLAIVREKAQKRGGAVSIESTPGVGTTFRIVLPTTLATFRGLLVREAEHTFVIPIANIERVMRTRKDEIKTVGNRETILVGGQPVSLVRLGDALGLARRPEPPGPAGDAPERPSVQVVVAGSADRRIAFQIEDILNEQEVLVKSLGKKLGRVRNIAAATVLPTGKVVPILNVHDLVDAALKIPAKPVDAVASKPGDTLRKSVLVVEDSITARTLLKSILESAGYRVRTAVDGVDALTAMRTESFDVVVSDVEMPRMNGFDLTAKIRSDKKLSEIPVVLVTALASREDRERGIEVGANAYIVKSNFDQSNLLHVIQTLI